MEEPVATSSTELPGFERVDLVDLSDETLTAEDLESSKKQLWLIKVPYEFDISKLNDTMLILNGTQELPTKMVDKDSGKRYETRASKYADGQSCPHELVVPSRKGNGLQVAKRFTGHLDILQTVKVPLLTYPPVPPPMYTDIPEGLKARWKPFGHRNPPLANSKPSDEEVQDRVGEKRQKVKEERNKESSREGKERKERSKKRKKETQEQANVKTEEKRKKNKKKA